MYLGIDLGTSNSAIAGNINGEVRLFKTSTGEDVLPSAIFVDRRGYRIYGRKAYEQSLLSPENVAVGFKRLIGTSTPIELKASQTTLSAEDCTGEILRQLLGQAFTETGQSQITGAVVTVPAAFNQMQSEATLRAAEAAGLDSAALLQEPIAAAMAAMIKGSSSGQFLVYDLGGGTFDLALVQSISGDINILAHEGVNMLGGRDFDRLILNNIVRPWLLDNFALPVDFQKEDQYRKILRIAQLAAEKAKIELSHKTEATIFAYEEEVRAVDANGEDVYLNVPIERKDLESLLQEPIERTIEVSRKILKDSGYSHEDIDKIVFIGGPSKTPIVRSLVSQELGIPTDLNIDPMTAVAIGAAVYCESRDWSDKETKRKASRGSAIAGGDLDLKYDYPARTNSDKALITVRVGDPNRASDMVIHIDTMTGWESGRKRIADGMTIEVPVPDFGENHYRINIFDESGRPVAEASTRILITRTQASAAGIPATHTISIKVLERVGSTRNILEPLVERGSLLPTSGTKAVRAARDMRAASSDHLSFDLFQDEYSEDPNLNLHIGSFQIDGTDFHEGLVRTGDEIILKWSMSDSGIITAAIEIPSISASFDTPKFYVPQAGHQSFDLDSGMQLAKSVMDLANEELEEAELAIGKEIAEQAEEIRKRMEAHHENLDSAHEADTVRVATEEARFVRQDIARLSAKYSSKLLERKLLTLRDNYNEYCRERADLKTNERFDKMILAAQREIHNDGPDAERIIDELTDLYATELWKDPGYVIYIFRKWSQERYRFSDFEKFDEFVRDGEIAISDNDISKLFEIVCHMWDIRIAVGGDEPGIDKLSTIMRA